MKKREKTFKNAMLNSSSYRALFRWNYKFFNFTTSKFIYSGLTKFRRLAEHTKQ